MSYIEDKLKLAVEHGVIKAYAINGSMFEINTGHSLITCDKVGVLQELKEMSPELFEDEATVTEEASVEKPKRKRTPKASG